ncbi:integrase, catalytic region, zinc finger, CCHC-type containing protein [Tanacetum coccineum]
MLSSNTMKKDAKENVQGRQTQGYAGNARKNQTSGIRVVNTVEDAGTNQPRVIRCYNCKGEGHIAKQCTAKKRVKDSKWFKDKMLLAQEQEARVVLNDEQQDFLDDSSKETDDYEDLQLQATTNFKADLIDAYDSDCHDEAITNAIFMAYLSPVGSINDDTVEPRYDSDILSWVPHYDTYHESDALNSDIQELGYIDNIVSDNTSYDEITSNNNVISYADYMVTIGNDDNNYVPPHVQKIDMILFVIEQMQSQVDKCNTINIEKQSVNESLTI